MELSLSESDDTIEPELRPARATGRSLRRMESRSPRTHGLLRPAGSIHPHMQAGLTRSPG